MTKSHRISVCMLIMGILLLGVLPAYATFPGKNGRITFILGPDVYTMNPDGSDVKQLTNLGPEAGAFWESWSPTGSKLFSTYSRHPISWRKSG